MKLLDELAPLCQPALVPCSSDLIPVTLSYSEAGEVSPCGRSPGHVALRVVFVSYAPGQR